MYGEYDLSMCIWNYFNNFYVLITLLELVSGCYTHTRSTSGIISSIDVTSTMVVYSRWICKITYVCWTTNIATLLLKTSYAKRQNKTEKNIKLMIYYLDWRHGLVTAAYNYFKIIWDCQQILVRCSPIKSTQLVWHVVQY